MSENEIPKDVVEAVAKAIYNSYWQGNDMWPDATTNERAMNIDMSKAAIAALVDMGWGRVDGQVVGCAEAYRKFCCDDNEPRNKLLREGSYGLFEAGYEAGIATKQPPIADMGWKMEGECRWKNEIIGEMEAAMKFHMDAGDILSTVAVNNCINIIRQTLPPQTGQVKRDGVEGGEL